MLFIAEGDYIYWIDKFDQSNIWRCLHNGDEPELYFSGSSAVIQSLAIDQRAQLTGDLIYADVINKIYAINTNINLPKNNRLLLPSLGTISTSPGGLVITPGREDVREFLLEDPNSIIYFSWWKDPGVGPSEIIAMGLYFGADFSQSSQKVVALNEPEYAYTAIDYDITTGYLYWTTSWVDPQQSVVGRTLESLDDGRNNEQELLIVETGATFRNIVVDPYGEHLYIVDTRVQGNSKIFRTDLTGQDRRIIVSIQIESRLDAVGLAFDQNTKRIYWTDTAGLRVAELADWDGLTILDINQQLILQDGAAMADIALQPTSSSTVSPSKTPTRTPSKTRTRTKTNSPTPSTTPTISVSPVTPSSSRTPDNAKMGCKNVEEDIGYCEGLVLYDVHKTLDVEEADMLAWDAYKRDLEQWRIAPLVDCELQVQNVTLCRDCLAVSRAWYCAMYFPRCVSEENKDRGICRSFCKERNRRCGTMHLCKDEFDTFPEDMCAEGALFSPSVVVGVLLSLLLLLTYES